MTRFDPWPLALDIASQRDLTLEEKLALLENQEGLTPMERSKVWAAVELDADRPRTGFGVLAAVASCMMMDVPLPEWLVGDFIGRLGQVNVTVATLDDPRAFGPLPARPKGEHLRTTALRREWELLLQVRFSPEGRIPRTEEGYAEASAELDGLLTPKQIKTLLPPIRRNAPRTSQKRKVTIAATKAHDPFSLTKRPKR